MKKRGYSLIELVVVLAIMSLLAALVTPSLSRFLKGVEFKATAKRVGGILRYCRSEAVNQGHVVQILFSPSSREIKIQSKDISDPYGEGKETSILIKSYNLPKGIRLEKIDSISEPSHSEITLFEFYPNGGSNGGSLLLENEDRNRFSIDVHFLTGVVKIVKVEA